MSQKFVMLFLVSKTQTVTLDTAAKVLIEGSQDSSSHSKYKSKAGWGLFKGFHPPTPPILADFNILLSAAKVRRLYDIANVLTSLNLIKKVHVREERGRKPAFKWLGSVDFNRSATAGGGLKDDHRSSVETPSDVLTRANSKHAHFVSVGSAVGVATVALPGASQPLADKDLRKARMTRHASFTATPAPASVRRQVSSAPCSPRPELRCENVVSVYFFASPCS